MQTSDTELYNNTVKIYERKIYKLKFWFTIIILILFAVVIGAGCFIINSANERDSQLLELRKEVNDLSDYKDTLSELGYTVDELENKVVELTNEIEKKQSELESINNSITDKQSKLNEISAEVDLIEKYNYALYDTEEKRNDITLDILKFVDTKCIEKNLDPNLVLGIIMVESEGHAGVTNKHSGAAGLGQFIPETGEFIATNYLNLSYDHSTTPYDGDTNVAMIVEYLSYLFDKYNGDTISVIKEYSGGDLNYAYNYYNKVLNAIG